ncbi:MAG: diaminopimelate epimerase [Saprospiraceae bacterium]|nr:diaminopimelate epimerase [Saprospiraceae bacterium]
MKFWKYQGAGNDFIMLDQRMRHTITRSDTQLIEHLCDRRFGIGADGLILLQEKEGYDFEMVYFNADGKESTMCGNGGRCIAAFAHHLGLVGGTCRFVAIDGPHDAIIKAQEDTYKPVWVELCMKDVEKIERQSEAFVLDTGSPHYVRFTDHLDQKDMVAEGRAVRYSDAFQASGINVNLVEKKADGLHIRTYERGVEDETLACGTGVTAAALSSMANSHASAGMIEVPVFAKGGQLSVRFISHDNGHFSDIWLCGPAQQVFWGEWPDIPFNR